MVRAFLASVAVAGIMLAPVPGPGDPPCDPIGTIGPTGRDPGLFQVPCP